MAGKYVSCSPLDVAGVSDTVHVCAGKSTYWKNYAEHVEFRSRRLLRAHITHLHFFVDAVECYFEIEGTCSNSSKQAIFVEII